METMGSLRRTNYCGEVSMSNVGQEMTVCGSIARARDKGGIIFADLRDTTGILQLVFDEDTPKDVFAKAESLKSEYVVICRGLLRERAAKTTKIATGDVELYVSELRILSEAQTPLPGSAPSFDARAHCAAQQDHADHPQLFLR